MIEKIIKKILSYVIKYDILLVYTFSRTPLFAIWLFIIIVGLFGGKNSNLVNLYCLCLVGYINGITISSCILCKSKKLNNWVTILVSPSFLERFAFNKGFSNLLIMLLPILAFSLIEIGSIKYEFRIKLEECEILLEAVQNYYDSNNVELAEEALQKELQIMESTTSITGYITQLANHSYILYLRDLLCRIFNL